MNDHLISREGPENVKSCKITHYIRKYTTDISPVHDNDVMRTCNHFAGKFVEIWHNLCGTRLNALDSTLKQKRLTKNFYLHYFYCLTYMGSCAT